MIEPFRRSGVISDVSWEMARDQELISGIARGEETALRILLDRHEETLRHRLRQMVRDESAADDLFQELCLRVWTRAVQWDGRGQVAGWLLKIATNLALNHLRGVLRRHEQAADPRKASPPEGDEDRDPAWMADPNALEPDAQLDAAERAETLRELLDQLPESKRDLLRLAHEEEMRTQEIAELLGIPEGTVKSRLHHATRALAEAWRRRWEGKA
jgi:RNA polymerase sigma-70 factor (ECF subfamily)